MSTLRVINLQNPSSGSVNTILNADGTTTFAGTVSFASGQTFPATSSINPPSTPVQGDTWYDTGVTPPVLKVWTGGAWVPVSNNQSAVAPVNPSTGQQWTDTSTNPPVLKIWNGSGWIPGTVAISNGVAPTSPVVGQLWSDTSTTPATLKAWNGGAWVAVQAAGGGGGGSGTVTSVTGGSGIITSPAGGITTTGSISLNPASVIAPSILTTTGDILYASAASTPARLGIGTTGQVLAVSAGGLPTWTTVAAGGVTSVTGTAPIVSSGGATPAISITTGNGTAINGTSIKVSIGSAGVAPNVSTATADAMTGSLYWDDELGALFYRYINTGGTATWVQAVPSGGGSSLTAATLGEAATGTSNTVFSSPQTSVPKDASGMTGAAILPASTTANRPGTPVAGMMRVNTTTQSTEAYVNSAWQTVASTSNGQLAGFRNLLINGNFAINQRAYVSGTATTGAGQYTLDRWKVLVSGQNLAFAASGNGNQITAPAGGVQQVIEAGNIGGGTYTLSWTGTATADVNGSTVSNGAQVTLPANTQATVTFTSGTVANAQLEPGSAATPFEQRFIATELMLCQRYYESGFASFSGGSTQFSFMGSYVDFKVTKRVAPTMFLGSVNWTVNNGAPTYNDQTTANTSRVSDSTSAGPSVSGFSIAVQTGFWNRIANTSGSWTASAEL